MALIKVRFNVGDNVFAKVKGYCAWPAKIEGIADMTQKQVRYHVYFYGTKQIAVCKEVNVFSYSENKHKYGKPKKIKFFKDALDEMEADIELGNFKPIEPKNIVKTKLSENLESGSKLDPDVLSPTLRGDESNILLYALTIEDRMLELQYEIQVNLSPERANITLCLEYLDELIALNINALMIKKHFLFVNFLQQLQKYNGNVREWDLSEERKVVFFSRAASLRSKAKVAFDKIQSLFHVPFGMTFQEFFGKEVETFRKATEGLSQTEYYSLF